jgi:PQQ-like domain
MSQGRDALSRTCPNCGASLEAAPPGRTVACRYCGQSVQTPPEVLPPPRVIVMAPAVARPAARVQRAATRGIFSAFFSLFVVGAVGFAAMHAKSRALASLPSLINLPNMPSGLVAAARASYMWDTVAGPPVPAAVGGASVEGFVGRIRTRGDDALWIVAFEGAHLGEVWRVGPFGTYSQGYQSTFTGVVGTHVIVTDYRAALHIYDVGTGKETNSLKLSDRAKAMCTAPDGKAQVWIEVSDEQNVLVDANAGTSTPAARPGWCPDPWGIHTDCRGWLSRGAPRPGCKGPESAPKVPGFEAENVVQEGDLAVAYGKKHPGTALPIVVGFDPKTKAVRWQQSLASGDQTVVSDNGTSMDALAGGRFSAPYSLTTAGWHFTAFDARSGQRLWDVPLASQIGISEPEGFAMSPARLYVMRSTSLEVYDAKTGTLVGTIGG